ncbi:MAG: aldehyde ferredoxin oxidoreductase family protein [Spirochaetota bacterium]|nr:MAG: aldehyde ferredoxin oxidoreductase family protein [Spirochaetota bacterium]
MQFNGWVGKVLKMNLSDGSVTKEPLDEELALGFIGGRGAGSKILWDETGPETDPLGPDNPLIINTGPVTGTLVPTSSRFTITSKSPFTGILGDANAGGFFAPEVKYAGYDSIIVKGVSEKPVYIWIDDEHVEVRDAKHLWGKTTHETEKILKDELSDADVRVLSIGQAGENLVKLAGVVTGDNIAARCGLGAVMGSKKLKAIAVRGTKSIGIANSDHLNEIVDTIYEDYKKSEAYEWYRYFGWTTGVLGMCKAGCAPVKNYMKSGGTDLEKRKAILDIESSKEYKFKDISCYGCPLACNKYIYIDSLGRNKAPVPGSSHMAVWEIYDYPFHVEVNRICEEYGMDIYSVQLTISAAMEWYERAIITKKDTDGMEIRFGDKEVAIALLHKIAKREGFGDILAEGGIRAGVIVGADPDTTATCGYGKGMDHGPIDCTSMAGLTLSLSVSTRGSGHLRSVAPIDWGVQESLPLKWQEFYKERGAEDLIGKPWVAHPVHAEVATYFEHICTSSDILEICKNTTEFYYFFAYKGREKKDDLEWHADYLRAVTGIDIDRKGLETITSRVLNIEKAYNVREGMLREHDMPSSRFLQKRKGGPLDGKALDPDELNRLFDHYYKIHGWDEETSIPKRATLEKLSLEYVADELEKQYSISKSKSN